MLIANSTIAGRFWPASISDQYIRMAVLAVLGSALVAVSAQINVPMIPVPMTLQTLAVLVVGGAYGSRLGAATLGLYALEGLVGLPVFAEMKAGPAVLAGPTGGYIIGFIFAAGLVGWLAERGWDRNIFKMFAAMVLGAAVLYVPGLAWLHLFTNGLQQTFDWGLGPFIVGDLVKAALGALAFPAAWKLLDRD
jgi:biotin transport system substrate-specific component